PRPPHTDSILRRSSAPPKLDCSVYPPLLPIAPHCHLFLPFTKLKRRGKKMQIRVKCNCGEGNCVEWGVVELQGFVEPQPGFQGSLANLQIGILCRPSSQGQRFP
ncbi:hypothetical protein KIW84_010787, partial [Lathyrus oleraceus]